MTTQKSFKSLPTPDQIKAMDRDLQFHPSTVDDPTALTRAQIEAYNREGYLKGIPIFDAEEILAQRKFFDEILAQVMAGGGGSYSIYSAHIKYATFQKRAKVVDSLSGYTSGVAGCRHNPAP